MATIIGSIMGISILSLPNAAVSVAKQDGWIATIIGSLYPLYIIFMAAIIIKKNPDTNIIALSKQYLGKVFGNILNFLFMAQFLYYAVMVVSADSNMLIVYSVWFMTPEKVILLFVAMVIYGSYRGIKVLARINVIALVGFCLMMLPTLVAFKNGSVLNVEPVFQTNWKDLTTASIDTSFVYANMELILVIHPYVKNKQRIIKTSLLSTLIIVFFYTWSVFTAVFYLGPDIVPKTLWPFYFVCEGIRIPVINNFRFIIMLIWPLFLYRTIATEYYMSTKIMHDITNVNYKKWCLILSPLLLVLPLFIKSELLRRYFTDLITPGVTIFNLAYVTLIALLVAVKSRKSSNPAPLEETI